METLEKETIKLYGLKHPISLIKKSEVPNEDKANAVLLSEIEINDLDDLVEVTMVEKRPGGKRYFKNYLDGKNNFGTSFMSFISFLEHNNITISSLTKTNLEFIDPETYCLIIHVNEQKVEEPKIDDFIKPKPFKVERFRNFDESKIGLRGFLLGSTISGLTQRHELSDELIDDALVFVDKLMKRLANGE